MNIGGFISVLATVQAAPAKVLALWQAQEVVNVGNSHLVVVFIGIVAIAMLIQAAVMVVLAAGAMKTQKALAAHVEEIKAKLMPLIEKSHVLVTDLGPGARQIATRVETITGHVEDISGVLRDKMHEFAPTLSATNDVLSQANHTVKEANLRTQEQVERVNGMVTSTLDATAQLGKAIRHGITVPGREIAGVVSGLKAALETLLDKKVGRAPVSPVVPYREYPRD